MGSSARVRFSTTLATALAVASAPTLAQSQAPLRPPAPKHAEVVLASGADGVLDWRECGLGDGGLAAAPRGELRQERDACVTPGGIRVECRTAGVKLTFPSGREVLVAPDGFVHLRSGESAGPFASGVELRLADGIAVRVSLAANERARLRDVVLVDALADGFAVQPWRRGEAAAEQPRGGHWAGHRLACLGDGGDLYRPVALGPLVVLERTLVAADRADAAPAERLVVLTAPLLSSLGTMRRQHREPEAAVRHAVTAVAAVADRGDMIFPTGASLRRAEPDRLRWVLRGGFELALDLEGPLSPRLQLFAGESPAPMIEWTMRPDAVAFLANPREDRKERRWHGNGTRLPRAAADLQAREHLFERGETIALLQRLRGDRPRR